MRKAYLCIYETPVERKTNLPARQPSHRPQSGSVFLSVKGVLDISFSASTLALRKQAGYTIILIDYTFVDGHVAKKIMVGSLGQKV